MLVKRRFRAPDGTVFAKLGYSRNKEAQPLHFPQNNPYDAITGCPRAQQRLVKRRFRDSSGHIFAKLVYKTVSPRNPDGPRTGSSILEDTGRQTQCLRETAEVTHPKKKYKKSRDESSISLPSPQVIDIMRNQFATPSQVSEYSSILFPTFSARQSVDIQYGSSADEAWFPGTVIALNIDGTYRVQYRNGDKLDCTANSKSCSRIKSKTSIDDNDFMDGYLSGEDCSMWEAPTTKSATTKTVLRRSHKEAIVLISTTGKVFEFPPQRITFHHKHRPRVKPGTTVVKKKLDGRELVGVIRQVLQSPKNLDQFMYSIQSKPGVYPPYYEVCSETNFLSDANAMRRWAICFPSRLDEQGRRVASSTAESDIYLTLTPHQQDKQFPPDTNRTYNISKGNRLAERQQIVNIFSRRLKSYSFLEVQRSLLDLITNVTVNYICNLPLQHRPLRPHWKAWVRAPRGHPYHCFQNLALLHNTLAESDSIVRVFSEIFLVMSEVADSMFDNPWAFAADPKGAYHFLRPAKGSQHAAISKGFNYGIIKAEYVIYSSKQLVVKKYCEIKHRMESAVALQLGECYTRESMLALPDYVLQDVPRDVDLFPSVYKPDFLNDLLGVGPKIRHLIAEACYGVNAGPAPDCHTIRYATCVGTGLLLRSPEKFCDFLISVYLPRQYDPLNQSTASIAQLLGKRCHGKLVSFLLSAASQIDMGDEITSYVNHYPHQTSEYPI
jgi:hypothetical protein